MMKRTLSYLLKSIEYTSVSHTESEVELTLLTSDSRQVCEGCIFVAVPGTKVDGHDYIDAAVSRGATVIVCERQPEGLPKNVIVVCVRSSSYALGCLASAWYGYPSRRLTLVGVTGTNGKTTIATLLYEMMRRLGYKCGLLSTVVNKIDEEEVAATHTTPDPIELNSLLAQMVDTGCEFVAMEVSSHAAVQHRIAGLDFDGGVFTNLSRDHLDFHKTMAQYLKAKQSFFDSLKPTAFALTNIDDRNGTIMIQNTKARRLTYSLMKEADTRVSVIESRLDGMILNINGEDVHTPFVGRFNASNLAAVYGAVCALGEQPEAAKIALSAMVPVAGRFQTFRSADGVTAIVDYAHTPDALQNVLDTIKDIVGNRAKIITVCGAGGDRDKGKRPIMAQVAAQRSSLVILTSDNPRSEDPMAILNDMKAGLDREQLKHVLTLPDRHEAIRTAVTLAGSGDVVLVAGKGHETYQIIGSDTHHFDDREEVTAALTDRTTE